MAWFIRKFLQILIILCVLMIIGVIIGFLFISPNKFRGQINALLQDHTGYEIEAKGPIDWSLGTQIVLHLNDVTLVGPQGFKSPFLSAKKVDLTVDLYSLFKDNLIINSLEATELVAVIEKQADGTKNVDLLLASKKPTQHMLTINQLSIKNSILMYQNEQTNRHWAFNNLNISTRSLALFPTTKIEAFTIKSDITNLDYNLGFNIDATVKVDLQKATIDFDPLALTWNGVKLNGSSSIVQFAQDPQINGKLSLDNLDVSTLLAVLNPALTAPNDDAIDQIKGDLTFNIIPSTRLITISDFMVQLGEGTIKGSSQFVLAAPYQANFNVTANKLNVIPFAVLARGLLPLVNNLPGVTSVVDLFKQISVTGKFAGTELTLLQNFKVEHVTSDLKIEQGVMQIGPVTAKAYEAAHNLSIGIDLNKQPPSVSLVQQGDNIVLETWINIFKFPPILTGKAVSKVSIQASGNNLLEIKQSATGNVNLSAKDGSVIGLDIGKLQQYSITSLNDVMNQLAVNKNLDLNVIVKPKAADWPSTQKSGPVTTYETFELSADIKQGVADTNIKLSSAAYLLTGKGSFNLANNQVNFNTQITNKELTPAPVPEIADFIKQAQLPLVVTGSLDQLVFQPDLQNYIVNTIKQAQDSLQKQAVERMVATTGVDAKTSKTAEEIFVDSIKGLKQ